MIVVECVIKLLKVPEFKVFLWISLQIFCQSVPVESTLAFNTIKMTFLVTSSTSNQFNTGSQLAHANSYSDFKIFAFRIISIFAKQMRYDYFKSDKEKRGNDVSSVRSARAHLALHKFAHFDLNVRQLVEIQLQNLCLHWLHRLQQLQHWIVKQILRHVKHESVRRFFCCSFFLLAFCILCHRSKFLS